MPNPNADLQACTSIFSPGTRQPGEVIGVLFDVFNAGPAATTDVTAQFDDSVGLHRHQCLCRSWNLRPGDRRLDDRRSPARTTARLVLGMQVNAIGPIDLLGVVTASSQPDPNPANNSVVIQRINRPPVANAGVDQSASTHTTVNLDGSASFDADGDPITFAWSLCAASDQQRRDADECRHPSVIVHARPAWQLRRSACRSRQFRRVECRRHFRRSASTSRTRRR